MRVYEVSDAISDSSREDEVVVARVIGVRSDVVGSHGALRIRGIGIRSETSASSGFSMRYGYIDTISHVMGLMRPLLRSRRRNGGPIAPYEVW